MKKTVHDENKYINIQRFFGLQLPDGSYDHNKITRIDLEQLALDKARVILYQGENFIQQEVTERNELEYFRVFYNNYSK